MKRVFLVGCPRSGTTLLQSLLAQHPEVATFPETHFFDLLVARSFAGDLGIASRTGREKFRELASDIFPGAELPLLDPRLSSWTKSLVAECDQRAQNVQASCWIEKTPKHLHFIETISRLIPGVQFLHIIRDGRDTVASLYDATQKYPNQWAGSRSLRQCAKRWVEDITISANYKELEDHTFVSYESLLEDPQREYSSILRSLNLSSADLPEQLDQEIFNSATQDEPWKEFRSSIRNQSNKFETNLNSEQKSQVTDLTKEGVSIVRSMFAPNN